MTLKKYANRLDLSQIDLFRSLNRVRIRAARSFHLANQLSNIFHVIEWRRILQMCVVLDTLVGHLISGLLVVHSILYRQVHQCHHQRASFDRTTIFIARNWHFDGILDFHDYSRNG